MTSPGDPGVPGDPGDPGGPSEVADLYWIPLGAGTPVVQLSGRIFEALSAIRHRRARCDLYHAALVITTPTGSVAVEQAPVPDDDGDSRGVVATGAVGTRWAGRFRVFRYEVRRWHDGDIPDLSFAVGGPTRLSDDAETTRRILDVLPGVPTPVWGRDQLDAGEMWNSNSVIAWTLTTAGVDVDALSRPPGGRAPGWAAGVAVARRGT
ncbi:MAG: hypothetical protein RIE08_12830 [Acidimicrobiales bacterium]